jgi:GNAT superfamily N-acetyltransferase
MSRAATRGAVARVERSKTRLKSDSSRTRSSSHSTGSNGKVKTSPATKSGRLAKRGELAKRRPEAKKLTATARKDRAARAAVRAAVPRVRLAEKLKPLESAPFSEMPPTSELRLALGRSGDHASVYHMLLAVFQGPSREEFFHQTEDPFYEPQDRLLVKRGFRVISHTHLIRRAMRFGETSIPVGGLQWLGTLPEFRNEGLATRLVHEAERRMIEDGALVGITRTPVPRFFHRAGWSLCGRHSFSQGKSREVLARIHNEHASRFTRRLNIRRWRHVEMPALLRIYSQNTQSAYGPLERTEAYWRWIIGRRAFDSLLVALDGPDKLELEETIAPIVGYAVLRQEQVVELCTAPGHAAAGYQLLARACTEAIERDRQDIELFAPAGSSLHRVVCNAGGTLHYQEGAGGEAFMVRILKPVEFLQRLAPEFEMRAKAAGWPRDCELGLSVAGQRLRLVYTRRGFRVRTGALGRSYLTLNRDEFTRLALGHSAVRDMMAEERIQASTQVAVELAAALFPKLPLWRPPWDDLPA